MGVTFIAKEGTYTAPATLTTKSITENGTYSAVDDSANGYSSVTVNVEGGGGSSDFSTAEVTVYNNTEIRYELQMAYYYDYENGGYIAPQVSSNDISTSIILNAVLYKGQSMCILRTIDQDTPSVTLSGDVVDAGHQTYIITGDGTITLSDGE